MTRTANLLLLGLALAALTWTVTQATQLPALQVLLLLAAGVVAQGFASWRPREPQVQGLHRPGRLQKGLAWLLRALIGVAVLSALLWAALQGVARL
jgi:hypothetical protein